MHAFLFGYARKYINLYLRRQIRGINLLFFNRTRKKRKQIYSKELRKPKARIISLDEARDENPLGWFSQRRSAEKTTEAERRHAECSSNVKRGGARLTSVVGVGRAKGSSGSVSVRRTTRALCKQPRRETSVETRAPHRFTTRGIPHTPGKRSYASKSLLPSLCSSSGSRAGDQQRHWMKNASGRFYGFRFLDMPRVLTVQR